MQPEFKLPEKHSAVAEQQHGAQELTWAAVHAAFPFWGITRQDPEKGDWNCDIVKQDVMVLVSSHPNKDLLNVTDGFLGCAETFHASLPVIVNKKPIKADEELILKWDAKPKAQPQKRQPKSKTWADDLADQLKKKMKTSGNK